MYAEVASARLLRGAGVPTLLVSAVLVLAPGCLPEFATIDDACRESPPSPRSASQVTTAAAARLNCHRRFLGVRELRIQDPLQTAAQDHTDYLLLNGSVEGLTLHDEDVSLDGATGATVADRVQAAGIDVSFAGQNRPLEVVFRTSAERRSEELVDRMMRDPEALASLLAPGSTGVGFGRGGELATAVVLATSPSNEAINEPLLWPAHGQLDVPRSALTSWARLGLTDLPESIASNPLAVPGHAITVLVGGTAVSADEPESLYELSFDPESVRFASPDAEQEVRVLGPGFFGGDVDALHVLPLEPLAPGTTYTLELDVTWGSPASTHAISMWFRTAEE